MARRLVLVVSALLLLALAGSPAAGAAPLPDRVALPAGFQPEGIEAAGGTSVYVGSLATGAIWRGDVRTGTGATWAAGVGKPGVAKPAVGMAIDRARGLLWVAGGTSGEVRAYDTRTAALERTYTFPGSGFLNDVAVTARGVYVTDSFVQRLAVVRFRGHGRLPARGRTLRLRGDISYVAGPSEDRAFNANGIVADGDRLVIAQSVTGRLFAVDPRTGYARTIHTFGADLQDADGLELRGQLLYVVRNFDPARNAGVVQRLALLPRGPVAVPLGTLTGDLDFPSTAAWVAGALYVVNARFATTPTPTTPYWITRLPG
jgi:outer membrane protein assembly factor BamB